MNITKQQKKLALAALIVIAALGGGWMLLRRNAPAGALKLSDIPRSVSSLVVSQIQEAFVTPPPLRAAMGGRSGQGTLTRPQVIYFTNQARKNSKLQPLAENDTLDSVAEVRLEDMFAKQYFAHLSPSGVRASDLAKESGYDYFLIGENLALGNFADDNDVVQAWMASPGHRANILNARYRDIGVAVGKGTFEGRTTWIAVQVFGLSVSVCPQPDNQLLDTITANKTQLQMLDATLTQLRAEIQASGSNSPQYQPRVKGYNALVSIYNNLIATTESDITRYNAQVDALNACVANVTK